LKKTVIKGIAFVVIFVISLVVISMVANQGNGDMTAPMPAASLPTMAIVEDGQEINQMYGYTMQTDTAGKGGRTEKPPADGKQELQQKLDADARAMKWRRFL